jgi:hypothetical protein
MNGSKKIFLILSIVFISVLVLVSIDISRRTTFPGSKPQLKQRIQDTYIEQFENDKDSIKKMEDTSTVDSIKNQISD